MKSKRVTWSCQHNCQPGQYNTVVCHDPVAIVSLTENWPLVQILDEEGNRIDCFQCRTIAGVGEAIARFLKGENLTPAPRDMSNQL